MKKILILILSLLFISCNSLTMNNFTFINNSDYTIDFKLKNYSDNNIYNIKPSEKIVLVLYDNPKIEIQNDVRAYFVSGNNEGNFYNMEKYYFKISNPYNFDIYVTEKNNYMDYVIKIKSLDSQNVLVYNSIPDFYIYYFDVNNNKIDITDKIIIF